MSSHTVSSRFDECLERNGASLLRLTFLLSREKGAAEELARFSVTPANCATQGSSNDALRRPARISHSSTSRKSRMTLRTESMGNGKALCLEPPL